MPCFSNALLFENIMARRAFTSRARLVLIVTSTLVPIVASMVAPKNAIDGHTQLSLDSIGTGGYQKPLKTRALFVPKKHRLWGEHLQTRP